MADRLGLGPGVPTPRRIRPVGSESISASLINGAKVESKGFSFTLIHESFEKGISSDFSEAEIGDLEELIAVYGGVFAETLEYLGEADVEACDFELLDNRPSSKSPTE
ncbi:hypothetical protein AYI69_g2124 [Smittium culicis]|uniref:Uncharacterized protein n=1 Tax=Smittium culicis TaxID=133412 RepID=A0A1R1YNE1_9FUNG|nr:hypothetical protein AYI69_g2124 [Smittium culicis]